MSRGPVPDLLTQCLGIRYRTWKIKSLEVRYRIPSQPYEDCLGVREYIVAYYTAVISGLFSQYFSCCFSHLNRISQKPLCSLYITSKFFMHGQLFFPCINYVFTHCIFIIAFSRRRAGIIDRSVAKMKMWDNKWGMKSQLYHCQLNGYLVIII